jgi:hypothetical protein
MRTIKINGHAVKLHDSIETMPITTFHRFNLYAAIDSGIGGTIEDVDRRLLRVRQFIKHNQQENAVKELDNMRQSMAFVIEHSNPEFLSFAALIHSIDGKEVQVNNEEDAKEVLSRLNKKGLTVGVIRQALNDVKKNLTMRWLFTFRNKKSPAKSSSSTAG